MAHVEIAAEAGACFGVERALKMVRTYEAASGTMSHTLGPLIHNPRVVAELAEQGVDAVDAPTDVPRGDTLFLRTHGVPPQMEQEALARGLAVVDATCPFVKRVHQAAEQLFAAGYTVVVVGEKGHPEVEGTVGHVPQAVVVGSVEEARAVQLARRVGVVVQTTLARSTLAEVVGVLAARCEELRVYNTICDATRRRQEAAAELARRADVMVVVGGRNSANTTHLTSICEEHCARTHHIEAPEELEPSWFEDAGLIGITAGASTPQDHIDAVRRRVEELA